MLNVLLIVALAASTDAPRVAVESRYTGGTLPDGVHLEQRSFRGLWVAGLTAFVMAYLPAAVVSAVLGSWHMFIPVYGQVKALQQPQPTLNQVFLTTDAIAQVAGVAMFVAGMCIKMPYVVRDTNDWQLSIVPQGLGVAVVVHAR